jgi:uncharacterized repeat protein (TIGR03803 family)
VVPKTLYSFCSGSYGNCPDGALPAAALIHASSGDLYGTTTTYGAGNCQSFCGTIFKITPSGTLTTLHQFCRQRYCPNGGQPLWALVQATNGDFYGTTYFGGVNGGGTVFSLSVGLGPFVETLTPSGEAGAAVTILGSDLTGATSVTFNGAASTFTVNSTGTAIATAVPTGASSGPVRVVTPAGALSSKPFQVLP